MTLKTSIDILFGFGLFINAILFIPQAVKLYIKKTADNLSFITFIGFNIFQLLTALHGYFHQDYILMLGAALSFITCGLVLFLIVLYNKNNF